MGIPFTIDNPEIVSYYKNQEERAACEDKRREQSWVSSGLLAAAGIAQIVLYHGIYSDVVDKRKELNDKIYACALTEHEHWRDHIHPHTLQAFEYAYNLPEIVIDYANPLTDTQTKHLLPGIKSWLTGTDHCDDCHDSCDHSLAAEAALALTGVATNLTRSQERRSAERRELKLQGMVLADRAGKNLGAPGRQAMGVALNINNTLVAMAASGLNSGMATFGRGLAGVATSLGGAS